MSDRDNKFMKHYGVKGMKWGVRRYQTPAQLGTSRDIGVSKVNQTTKAYMAANVGMKAENSPKTAKEAKANLGANQKKFDDKFSGGDSDKSQSGGGVRKWWGGLDSDTKGTLITVGVYAGLIGAAYLYGKKMDVDYAKIATTFKEHAGKSIDASTFNKHVAYSQAKSWLGEGYINDASFTRSAFDIPAGNTFHRLSTTVESSFKEATYSTHNIEDYNRYVTAFTKEKGNVNVFHKTFTTKTPTKVPALPEVLETLRTIMAKEYEGKPGMEGVGITEKMVLSNYQSISGGKWIEPRAKNLLSALKSKGYGALVDEMDAGVIGQSPLVFFDSENAVAKGHSSISLADKKKAAKSLIEIMNRKG